MSVILLAGLSLLCSCRSNRELPPPEPVPELLSRPQMPRRGVGVSDFERLANWQVFSDAGDVTLSKELSKVMWGRSSARIRFTPSSGGGGTVTLIPAEPWVILSQFDTVLLWMLHEPAVPEAQPCQIRLRYRDRKGELGEWRIPYEPSAEMQMLHLRINEAFTAPLYVESLIWDLPGDAGGVQDLYLDSLSLYQEVLSSIPQTVHYVRPHGYAPAFAPKRKNSVELNFPLTNAAFRPQTTEEKSHQALTRSEEGDYRFTYQSKQGELSYRIRPEPGFPAVEFLVDGTTLPLVWRGAEILTGDGVPELRYAGMSGELLNFQYTHGIQFSFSLHGKTLQIDVNSLLENVTALQLGGFFNAENRPAEHFSVPFFRTRADHPWPVVLHRGKTEQLMVTLFPDWWMSLASRHRFPAEGAGGLGDMVYEPRWRGSRNMFRERLYLTVSGRLDEVLPSPASPPAIYRDTLGVLTAEQWDNTASLNVLAISPLDEEWRDQLLARLPDGEWLTHPEKGYVIKTALFDGLPLSRLQTSTGNLDSENLLIPSAGAHPPWRMMDYDVRSIGAAGYSQTYAELGALLQQLEAEWGGPVLGRGGAEWFWSGLISAVCPEFPNGLRDLLPVLPHFAWRNVLPGTRLLGLGELTDMGLPGEAERPDAVLLDRLLAMQVAYGAVSKIPKLADPRLERKAERILTPLHGHFRNARVERIAYWNGTGFVDAGEARTSGDLPHSRLYLRLDTDTEIWVNGHTQDPWTVRLDGREWPLPPFGFLVRGDDLQIVHLPATSAEPGLTLVQTEDARWVFSPEKEVEELSIRVKGSLYIQQLEQGGIRMELDHWQGEALLSETLLGLKHPGSVKGVTPDGSPAEGLSLLKEAEGWRLKSDSDLHRVWVSPELQGSDLKFSP